MTGIRVGIVGVGFGQQVLIPAFHSVPKFTVTAVAASSAQRAERVRERFGLRFGYGDWRDLVDSKFVDVVAIAVPPMLQPMVIQAHLMRASQYFVRSQWPLMSPMPLPLVNWQICWTYQTWLISETPELPVWQRVRDILLTGEIGPIRHITVQWNLETLNVLQQNYSWKRLPEQGVGY